MLTKATFMTSNYTYGSHSSDLSLVNTIGKDCRIYRMTSGHYLVSRDDEPLNRQEVATLACAYATCRGWEHVQLSSPASSPTAGPSPAV